MLLAWEMPEFEVEGKNGDDLLINTSGWGCI